MSAAAANPPFTEVKHRGLITVSVMAAMIMVILDLTIANVALPHMQASLGAAQDTITWVLTSYIVAAPVNENQAVAAGDVLFKIDDQPYKISAPPWRHCRRRSSWTSTRASGRVRRWPCGAPAS